MKRPHSAPRSSLRLLVVAVSSARHHRPDTRRQAHLATTQPPRHRQPDQLPLLRSASSARASAAVEGATRDRLCEYSAVAGAVAQRFLSCHIALLVAAAGTATGTAQRLTPRPLRAPGGSTFLRTVPHAPDHDALLLSCPPQPTPASPVASPLPPLSASPDPLHAHLLRALLATQRATPGALARTRAHRRVPGPKTRIVRGSTPQFSAPSAPIQMNADGGRCRRRGIAWTPGINWGIRAAACRPGRFRAHYYQVF